MPRNESYLLRLSTEEKDELGNRAREQGISIAKLIRQRLELDASGKQEAGHTAAEHRAEAPREQGPLRAEWVDVPPIPAEVFKEFDDARFEARVATLSRTMPKRSAELLARKEMN